MGYRASETLIFGLVAPFKCDRDQLRTMIEKAEELGIGISFHGNYEHKIHQVIVGNYMPSITESNQVSEENLNVFSFEELTQNITEFKEEMLKMKNLTEEEKMLLIDEIVQVFNSVTYTEFIFSTESLKFLATIEVEEV